MEGWYVFQCGPPLCSSLEWHLSFAFSLYSALQYCKVLRKRTQFHKWSLMYPFALPHLRSKAIHQYSLVGPNSVLVVRNKSCCGLGVEALHPPSFCWGMQYCVHAAALLPEHIGHKNRIWDQMFIPLVPFCWKVPHTPTIFLLQSPQLQWLHTSRLLHDYEWLYHFFFVCVVPQIESHLSSAWYDSTEIIAQLN